MNLFPKFDPRSVSFEAAPPPAKAAKLAKVNTQTPLEGPTLASLATLAGPQGDFEERAAIVEFDGEIPREWAEGLAKLDTMLRPQNISETRWRQAVGAAGHFCDRWAAKASALGWTTVDIFGVDRIKPEGALHMAGLIWLLQGKEVVAISDDAVVVETVNGARQSFRPRLGTSDAARRVLLWELDT